MGSMSAGSLNPNCPSGPQLPTQAQSCPRSVPQLQLMSTILIMVMMKKDRALISTFTKTAVIRNTSRIATRLPRTRTD